VIAHEIAHIKNRDVLLMVMCSVLLGTMIILSHYPSYLSWGETTITKQQSDRKKYSDSKNLRIVFFSILFAWVVLFTVPFEEPTFDMYFVFGCLSLGLTPVAMIVLIGLPFSVLSVYYAISRRREYLADATAALYTRYPEGLASALEKIAVSTDQLKSAKPALAPIYIANPFSTPGTAKYNNTSSHPSISERIRILRSMTHISLIDYDRSYREVRGTDKSMIPAYAMTTAGTASLRSAIADDLDFIQRRRETSNLLWNLNNYKLIRCPCGTKMRLPPSFKLAEVRCPHCGKVNPV
jgi:heat shock protein HtpX